MKQKPHSNNPLVPRLQTSRSFAPISRNTRDEAAWMQNLLSLSLSALTAASRWLSALILDHLSPFAISNPFIKPQRQQSCHLRLEDQGFEQRSPVSHKFTPSPLPGGVGCGGKFFLFKNNYRRISVINSDFTNRAIYCTIGNGVSV